jgi:D-glycero-D-manno-heptose 1,7-bisphosphate phosphatase
LYHHEDVLALHRILQEQCRNAIDHLLYAPWHRSISSSLSAKPGSLMIERGLALTKSSAKHSWIIGDAERDLKAGLSAGLGGRILIPSSKEQFSPLADFTCKTFSEAVEKILIRKG